MKMRAVGLRARPGSGEPKPVSVAVMGPLLVWRVRVPVRAGGGGGEDDLEEAGGVGGEGSGAGGPPVGWG